MQLMDEAGMMDEKNLEYFKRVVEEREDKNQGVSYETRSDEKSF